MHGEYSIKFKAAITGMYPWIPWELVADPLGSAEHILGTTGPDQSEGYSSFTMVKDVSVPREKIDCGVKLTTTLDIVSRLRVRGFIPPISPSVCMAWHLIK
jgi:hypothetical protein